MPFVDPLTNALAGDAANSLFQTLQSNLGIVPNMYRTLGHAPQVLQSVMSMGKAIRADLDPKIRELAYLKVVQLLECNY
jgi:alkylhydroperoxidase family enzyme